MLLPTTSSGTVVVTLTVALSRIAPPNARRSLLRKNRHPCRAILAGPAVKGCGEVTSMEDCRHVPTYRIVAVYTTRPLFTLTPPYVPAGTTAAFW
jgi:hypothetical protein